MSEDHSAQIGVTKNRTAHTARVTKYRTALGK